MIKGIYLCCGHNTTYEIENVSITYIDKFVKGDNIINVDCIDYLDNINKNEIDFIIATPPCNYYSRANWRRETSTYSQETKHILPTLIEKLRELNIPFLIENVINDKLQADFLYNAFTFKHARHRYWTNIEFDLPKVQKTEPIQYMSTKQRQGDVNVHNVITSFIEEVKLIIKIREEIKRIENTDN